MKALRLAAVLLCMLYISEAFSVPRTRCCTQLGEKISKNLLKKAKRYEIQRQDGSCHLQAVLLHLRSNKTLCVSPKNKRVQQWIKRQEERSSGNQESRKNHPGRKKRRGKPKNKKKKIKKRKQRLI